MELYPITKEQKLNPLEDYKNKIEGKAQVSLMRRFKEKAKGVFFNQENRKSEVKEIDAMLAEIKQSTSSDDKKAMDMYDALQELNFKTKSSTLKEVCREKMQLLKQCYPNVIKGVERDDLVKDAKKHKRMKE